MESLSYEFEGREPLLTDDIELQMDGIARSRTLLKGWDQKPLPTLVNDGVYGMGILEPFSLDTTRKPVLSNHCLENSVEHAYVDSGNSAPTTCTITLDSLAQFGQKISSSATDEEFALTEFEMEKLGSTRVPNGNQLSNENLGLSSPKPSVSAKRARITNLQLQNPVCQVYGCNKDLSSSKDYHKRHKVCHIHSKTSVVIVNGIKQRFCQQCSRFHVLAEFDEDKRSCRKRLAGHNQRRRKPLLANHFGRDLSRSFLFSDFLPGVFFGNGPTNYSRHTMIDKDEYDQTSQLTRPAIFHHSLVKPLIHPLRYCPNTPLSVKELPVGSNSSCALSLLSVLSQNSETNSAGMSMAHYLNFKKELCGNEDFTTSSGKSTPISHAPSSFNSWGEVEQGVSDSNVSAGFEIPQNELMQETASRNLKCYTPPKGANTVDLLQLSLHLQRVEQQKYSAQVKLENGVFCHSTIT